MESGEPGEGRFGSRPVLATASFLVAFIAGGIALASVLVFVVATGLALFGVWVGDFAEAADASVKLPWHLLQPAAVAGAISALAFALVSWSQRPGNVVDGPDGV